VASKINGMTRHVDGVDMRFVGFVGGCCRVLTGRRRSRAGNPRLRAKFSESLHPEEQIRSVNNSRYILIAIALSHDKRWRDAFGGVGEANTRN